VKIGLSGTPIENSVLDIWSISDFARPGYLGSREEFKQHYEKPIQSEKASTALHQRFRRRLKPLILRRTKLKVATDLPEKLEEIIYGDLSNKQKDLYAGILRESRNKINHALPTSDELHRLLGSKPRYQRVSIKSTNCGAYAANLMSVHAESPALLMTQWISNNKGLIICVSETIWRANALEFIVERPESA